MKSVHTIADLVLVMYRLVDRLKCIRIGWQLQLHFELAATVAGWNLCRLLVVVVSYWATSQILQPPPLFGCDHV